MKRTTISLSFVCFTLIGYASTLTWTNKSGDSNWGNPLNWDMSVVPCETNTVILPKLANIGDTYTINLNGNRSVNAIEMTALYPPFTALSIH